MDITYSNRINRLNSSEVKEFLKLSEKQNIISFAGGFPAPELFPVEQINIIINEVMVNYSQLAFQYSSTEGYTPLREIICTQRMDKLNIDCDINNIIITHGAQQGLDFSAKLFINKGDIIICEKPTYIGALDAFNSYEPEFLEVSMDDEGMKVDELEELLKTHDNIKMIYTIPDFQNPSGRTMSIERRKKLAALATEFKIPVIEDNPYGELSFNKNINPPIKSFDTKGYVIFLGTFSKTFCPGLRVGWICASPSLIEKYVLLKQGSDLQCSTFNQILTSRYMETYNLDNHINNIIEVYKSRKNIMIDSMQKYFPKKIKFTNPSGGLFTWVELEEEMNSSKIFKDSINKNIAFVIGDKFFPKTIDTRHLRLNYSNMTEDKIIEGINRLGDVLYNYTSY